MKAQNLLLEIVSEFAETLDDTLLPQTTISSLGLRFALKMRPQLNEAIKAEVGVSKPEAFARAIAIPLAEELDYHFSVEALEEARIRIRVKTCPFMRKRSQSLCSMMQGIVGGLCLMSFGYGKIVPLGVAKLVKRSCTYDLFLKQTEESDAKAGVEFSKESIVLLRGFDEGSLVDQRMARRKLVLGLFSSLAYSLHERATEKELAHNFIEALSCVPGVASAALYLKGGSSEQLTLAAHFGIPETIMPLVREIGTQAMCSGGEAQVLYLKDLDAHWQDALKKLSIRFVTPVLLRAKERTVGVVYIAWNVATLLTPELRDSIRAACVLLGATIDNNRVYSELERVYVDNLSVLNKLAEVADRFAHGHSKRVAALVEEIAVKMGLPQEEINLVYEAGMLHDIGKIVIPPEILNKEDRLTEEEFAIVKEHPVVGANLLAPISVFEKIVPTIRHHHERLDGSGYPDGLAGDAIPLHARIIAVADVYDAMTCRRSYREALHIDEVLRELKSNGGAKFDAEAVEALIVVLNERGQLHSDQHPEQSALSL